MATYDVALWLMPRSPWPEWWADGVEAAASSDAALLVLRREAVSRVWKVAVRLPDGTIRRWYNVRLSAQAVSEQGDNHAASL